MKKLLLLSALTIFFFACRGQGEPQTQKPTVQEEDISLEKLTCEGQSILEKMDANLTCTLAPVEKFSVALMAKPKDENGVSVSVETFGHSVASGNMPDYTAYLADGGNTIKVICTSKKNSNNKKEYTIRITKRAKSIPSNESSKLKELKFEGKDILNRLSNKNACELSDVDQAKSEGSLIVVAENASASVMVHNGNEKVESVATNTYKVGLAKGLNEIYVKVTSEKEGEKLYVIRVYREEDLTLKSFNVDSREYCEKGKISAKYLRFESNKQSVKVAIQANSEATTLILKQNGTQINANDGFYTVNLANGNNGIEVTVEGKGAVRSKNYSTIFVRLSANSPNSALIKLSADGDNLLPKISSKNIVVLPSCEQSKKDVKLEVLISPEYEVKVTCNSTAVQVAENSYTATLQDNLNTIVVSLNKGSTEEAKYTIYITRYPQSPALQNPATDEVKVSFVVTDGVNGHGVDGSTLKISNTQTTSPATDITVTVRNGKAQANLKKNAYYDFKIEGQREEHSPVLYAASNVISYYVGESSKVVHIVQRPLQRITKEAKAPEITELTFDSDQVQAGEEKEITEMKDISVKVSSSSIIENLSWASPFPMLGVGFVPSTADGNKEPTNVFYAKNVKENEKGANNTWTSEWKWECSTAKFPNDEYVDVVAVIYDVASNRVERHIRLKKTDHATASEEEAISITDLRLKFERYPTQSHLYSVGPDEGTGQGGYYKAEFSFYVNNNGASVKCTAFDLYRKCVDDTSSDFTLVKHVVNKTPIASEAPSGYQTGKPHVIYESDSLLEDGKTYQYKVIAYIEDNKKSKLDSSPLVQVKVPKSTALLLEYPCGDSLTLSQAKNMQFAYRFSNPEALKDAKEVEMGLMIAERTGEYIYGSKFKYVFEDADGKPELYFADAGNPTGTNYSQKRNEVTSKEVEELIIVDTKTGTVKITKDFLLIIKVNLIGKKVVNYKKGTTYCWDVLNWGEPESSFYDNACKITMKTDDNVTVTVPVNDKRNGQNAWNGRAEFTIKWD